MENEPLIILLVEDNPDHTELLMRNFQVRHMGNRIIEVRDGEEALDYLFRRGKYTDPGENPQPHLILLDLRLPKIDGIQVLKEIKSNRNVKSIPIVVVTTSEAEKDLALACINHANSYLVKPVNFDAFCGVMIDLGFRRSREDTGDSGDFSWVASNPKSGHR